MASDNRVPVMVVDLANSLDGPGSPLAKFNVYNTLVDIHAFVLKALNRYEKVNGLKITGKQDKK